MRFNNLVNGGNGNIDTSYVRGVGTGVPALEDDDCTISGDEVDDEPAVVAGAKPTATDQRCMWS